MVNVIKQDQPHVQDQQQQNQNIQVCRTHQDDAILLLLSKLSLSNKLSMNKDIEEKNKERELKTLHNKQEPVLHPDPESETAHLVTIAKADIEDLKDPSMFARCPTRFIDPKDHSGKQTRERRKRQAQER
jgi:hypothetical protein